jgi:arylsulfatase B
MSARYPANVGLQHGVIMDSLKVGLPLTEKLAPEYMKYLGYATHMVGKWSVTAI